MGEIRDFFFFLSVPVADTETRGRHLNVLKYPSLKACAGEAELQGGEGQTKVLTWVPSAGPLCCCRCAGQRCPSPGGAHSLVGESCLQHPSECVVVTPGVCMNKRRDLEVVAGSRGVRARFGKDLQK